jgi:predicted permease
VFLSALTGICLYIWPHETLEVLKVFGIIGGWLAVYLGAIYFLSWLAKSKPKKTIKTIKWATCPLWILPYLFWRIFEKPLRAIGRWLVEEKLFRLPLAADLVIGILIALPIIFTLLHQWKALRVYGIIVGIFVGFIALAVGLTLLQEKLKKRHKKSKLTKALEGTADTVKLVGTYAMQKKEGTIICPLIFFDDEVEPEIRVVDDVEAEVEIHA